MTAGERQCIKCGRAVPAEASICEICNRARMATPSASQYHGTIAVAIIVGVAALGFAGTLALRGVGPYRGAVVAVTDAPGGGIEVSIEVVNEGTRPGRASCRVVALDADGRRLGIGTGLSPAIDGGERVVFSQRLARVTQEPDRLSVDCG